MDTRESVEPARIRLSSLALHGPGITPAEVKFHKGLNVILGFSNTGKTFLAECINFMLGGGKPPKEIPESAYYDSITMSFFVSGNGNEFVLRRSLKGGEFMLREGTSDALALKAKHHLDDADTLSHFLLDRIGLSGKKIQTDKKQGKTRFLSFRDLAKYVYVDEVVIQSTISPIHSGENAKKTAESSVFRLLLTGHDDSSVITGEDSKIVKGRTAGRVEVWTELLEETRQELGSLDVGLQENEVEKEIQRVQGSIDELNQRLVAEQAAVAVLEAERQAAWVRLRKADSKMVVLSELQGRFELLRQQYSSDLSRLEAISEASQQLDLMSEEMCPVCGASPEHHDRTHEMRFSSPAAIADSCFAEAGKIRLLLKDLEQTVVANAADVVSVTTQRNTSQSEFETAAKELSEELRSRISKLIAQLVQLQEKRSRLKRVLHLQERLSEIADRLKTVKATKAQRGEGFNTTINSDLLESFSQEIEFFLREWHFPGLTRVTFSDNDEDAVISGQRRASHGKGVRAITHAAFNLAVLKYCIDRRRPHPGFLLLDSPLVVYRQPDEGEKDFSPNVKEEFYRNIARQFENEQIIIMENDGPPEGLANLHVEKFSHTEGGRKGFLLTAR